MMLSTTWIGDKLNHKALMNLARETLKSQSHAQKYAHDLHRRMLRVLMVLGGDAKATASAYDLDDSFPLPAFKDSGGSDGFFACQNHAGDYTHITLTVDATTEENPKATKTKL